MTDGVRPNISREADRHNVARLDSATKRFGEIIALDALDLRVGASEAVALLGPNGAGKTTAVRLMLGLARPTTGSATLFGANPMHRAARARAGAMLQIASAPAVLTVRELIELFSSYYPHPFSLQRTLKFARLDGLERRRFGRLSGGEQKRLFFALAICGDPDVLFLDEPTSALDIETRLVVWDQIRELVRSGKSVLLTTHDLAEAETLADRVVVLTHGAVRAEGSPRELAALTSSHTLQDAYLTLMKGALK